MTIYREGFDHASTDDGHVLVDLTSTEEETKKAIKVVITNVDTQPVLLDVKLEREDIATEIPLETVISRTPSRELDLDIDIPIGQKLEVIAKPQVAGSQGTVVGWIEYEITG